MPIWPFRRMGRRKRPPSQAKGDAAASEKRSATLPNPTTAGGAPTTGPPGLQRKLSRRSSNRRDSARRRASTKDSATFEKRLGEKTGSDLLRMDTPGTSDADLSPRRRRSDELTALPVLKELGTSPHLRPITREYDAGIPYDFYLQRESSSLPTMPHGPATPKMQRVGSNKRSATGPVVGRKLSKRRKDERVREEEIRAMAQPLPLDRFPYKSGSVLRKDSRRMKTGLNRHLDRPSSTISLPLAESIHSSMSGDSGNNAVAISVFHVFAPRPSIRLSSGPPTRGLESSRWAPPREPPIREPWRAQSLPLATEEILTASRTIDDLADDLDAGALRDLMERDARRKEKRRKLQEERLREKLERRAERQRLREQREQELAGASHAQNGPPSPGAGLGIGMTESPPVERRATPMDLADAPFTEILDSSPTSSQRRRVSGSPTREESQERRSFLELPTPMQATRHEASSIETPLETPMEELARAVHYSHTSASKSVQKTPALSPPASPTETARPERTPSPQPPSKRPDRPVVAPLGPVSNLHPTRSAPTDRKASASTTDRQPSGSDPRTRRRGSGWTAFFRRGTNLARRLSGSRRSPPSDASFSNTSRESMARQPLPAHLVQPPPVRQRSAYRTQSKFREDLPELPLSPPDSRVQSPEVTSARAAAARKAYPDLGAEAGRSSASPAFDDQSGRSMSPSPARPSGADSALMSASLASVDSDASWLSGKPSKRVGRGNRPHQNSVGSSMNARSLENPFNASYEELGIPDEEYFHRLTPRTKENPDSHLAHDPFARKISTNTRGYPILEDEVQSNDMDALSEGAVVHSGVERHPTVVHREAPHVKSREGLLNEFLSGERTPTQSYLDDATPFDEGALESDDGERETDLPPSPHSAFRYQRAKSVDLGKGHVRQISAGSAKLLDIPPSRRNSRRESSQSPNTSAIAVSSLEGATETEGED